MKSAPRLTVFSLAAVIAYTLAYYFDWPLFQYDLKLASFRFTSAAGPAILWYGWIATAVLMGAIAALAVPPRIAAKLPADLIWLVPAGAVIAAFFYEQRWFPLLFNAQSALGN